LPRVSCLTAALAIVLLPVVLALLPSSAAAVAPPFRNPALAPINPITGDASFVAAFGRSPSPADDEDLWIDTHLAFVIEVLASRDVSALPPSLQAARCQLLDRLREYRGRREFPRNYDRIERAPCFIDRDDNICAVGYLIEQSAGREMAEAINAKYQYASLTEIATEPQVRTWIAASGFTVRELAMIQPWYLPMAECCRFTGHSYSSGGFPPSKLWLVAKVDPEWGMFAGRSVEGELTLVIGELTLYGAVPPNSAVYGAGTLQLWEDPLSNSIYLPYPPSAAVPAWFSNGSLHSSSSLLVQWLGLSFRPETGGGEFAVMFKLDGGDRRDEFGHGYVEIYGTVRRSSIAGYDLDWEGTVRSGCMTPVADATWGRIKAQYR
jgi:hypothetical protein